MTTNTSLEDIEVFSWDIDNSMWSSFGTPYAYTTYKWIAIAFCLCFFEIILLVVVPFGFLLTYIPNFMFWIHDVRVKFNRGYTKVDNDAERDIFIKFSKCVGSIWHAHEMVGMENVPDGPSIFYIYHGPIAVDGPFVYSKLQASQKRLIFSIAHRKEVNVYGHRRINRTINYCAPSRVEVINRLKQGWQLLVAIGGLEESKISDNNYRVHIPINRTGIAHIVKAITDQKIPIVPIFTRNIQEAYWMPWFSRQLLKIVPKNMKVFVLPVGGLPVKLKTFIGKEIEYDISMTVEEIMDRLRNGLQSHIDKYQIVPGSRLRALRERYCSSRISPYSSV